jgi:hypothetical protein
MNLTIRGSYFHDNQEGILGGAGELLIESTEFGNNGNCINPDGCAHNMYISNSVTKFTLQYCYSHSAIEGHLVKSRAQENHILYNRLSGEDSSGSYEINLPNAGTSYVIGNLIQQGPNSENSAILDFGSEGASNPGDELYVVNNTFVNDRTSGGTFVSIDDSVTTPAVITNNIFAGTGMLSSQSSSLLDHNFFAGDPLFSDAANFDYALLEGSPCLEAGTDPGTAAGGFSLLPAFQYLHPTSFELRTTVDVIDIGAYERGGGSAAAGAGNEPASGGAGAAGPDGEGGTNAGATAGTSSNSAGAGGSTSSGGNGAVDRGQACPDGSDGCESNDCSCRLLGSSRKAPWLAAVLGALGLASLRQLRRRREFGRRP